MNINENGLRKIIEKKSWTKNDQERGVGFISYIVEGIKNFSNLSQEEKWDEIYDACKESILENTNKRHRIRVLNKFFGDIGAEYGISFSNNLNAEIESKEKDKKRKKKWEIELEKKPELSFSTEKEAYDWVHGLYPDRSHIFRDFMKLVRKNDSRLETAEDVDVLLASTDSHVEKFKKKAKNNGGKYAKKIKNLLDFFKHAQDQGLIQESRARTDWEAIETATKADVTRKRNRDPEMDAQASEKKKKPNLARARLLMDTQNFEEEVDPASDRNDLIALSWNEKSPLVMDKSMEELVFDEALREALEGDQKGLVNLKSLLYSTNKVVAYDINNEKSFHESRSVLKHVRQSGKTLEDVRDSVYAFDRENAGEKYREIALLLGTEEEEEEKILKPEKLRGVLEKAVEIIDRRPTVLEGKLEKAKSLDELLSLRELYGSNLCYTDPENAPQFDAILKNAYGELPAETRLETFRKILHNDQNHTIVMRNSSEIYSGRGAGTSTSFSAPQENAYKFYYNLGESSDPELLEVHGKNFAKKIERIISEREKIDERFIENSRV